jgi:hypothetical protein
MSKRQPSKAAPKAAPKPAPEPEEEEGLEGNDDDESDEDDEETGTVQEVEMSQEEFGRMLMEHMTHEVSGALERYTNLGEELRLAHARAIVQEQFQIMDEVLPTLVEPELVREYPTIIIKVVGPNGQHGSVAVPKSLTGQDDPGQGLYSAFMLALLSTPIARALLRVNGFQYTFAQSKTPVSQKGRIIM